MLQTNETNKAKDRTHRESRGTVMVSGLRLTTETGGLAKTSCKLSQGEPLIIAETTQQLATKNRPNMSNFEQNFKENSAVFDGGKLNGNKGQ